VTLPGDSAKIVVHGKGISTDEGFWFRQARLNITRDLRHIT
jgi:hypothetical protein